MYLLEHDAKEFLTAHGVRVPEGRLIEAGRTAELSALPRGPWVVKGQISAGARSKAGIIKKASSAAEVGKAAGVTVSDTLNAMVEGVVLRLSHER